MNACCSIVKFFVVLMNLVFWVCTWSWCNSSNPQKRFTFFREIPFFFWWAKRFFFLPFLFSPRGTQKTTPLSHQHTRPSNSNITTRSVAAVRASCWENIVVRSSQGDEDVFAAVKQFFFSSHWRSLVNIRDSVRNFRGTKGMKIQFSSLFSRLLCENDFSSWRGNFSSPFA